MNGRVYDYRLGRFLSVDPIISNPANSQSINPYSYIGNNPLSGVDPTGYACMQVTCSHFASCDGDSAKAAYETLGTRIAWVNPPTSANNGAKGQSSQQANSNPTDHGSAPQTAQQPSDGSGSGTKTPSRFGWSFWAGLTLGTMQALAPGGALLGSPAPDDIVFEAGRAIGLGATGGVQLVTGGAELLGGGALTLGGAATAPTGVGAAAAVGGGVLAGEGAATAALGAVNVIAAGRAWSHVQEMRGSGDGGGSGEEQRAVALDEAKQGKHVPGHNNYLPGRSPLTHSDPQGLLDRFAGEGQPVGNLPRGQPGFRERVDFGEAIGQVNGQPTTKGIIHYLRTGAHIVPAMP